MEIVLRGGRRLLFRCAVSRHGGRILTYMDATRIKQEEERLCEAERTGAELRFSMETMEDQASYLASLAEESDANRQRAEAARQQLEHEITERQLLEKELRVLATTDALTGTLNRRHFFTLGQRLAVLMVDIDHFKAINDRNGHAVGDEALKHVVACLQTGLRRDDLLGRIGGEEFAVVLPDIGVAAAAAIADRLRTGVATKPLVHGGGELTMTVSVGLAMARDGDSTVDQVIARADAQLYRAKSSGRNRVCFENTAVSA
jgi:diguanylate cyclase (GGDEF)-like protein